MFQIKRVSFPVLALAMALLLVLAAPPAQALAEARAGNKLYKQVLRGTVRVHIRQNGRLLQSGTGWVVDEANRLIVTNHHVVENADTAYVTFPLYEGGRVVTDRSRYDMMKAIPGKVLTTDVSRDLAVIQLRSLPPGVTELKLAAEEAGHADVLHLVGNPGASAGFWAYVSGKVRQVVRRSVRYDENQVLDARMIESDMASNRGDSGAAVVNDKGEVVGVNSGAATSTDIRLVTFAIELSELRVFLAEVRTFLAPEGASTAALNHRGQRYLTERRLDRAIADFSAALAKDRDFAIGYRNRGRAYYLKDDCENALADLNEVLRLSPTDALAYNARGNVWSSKGDKAHAKTSYAQAIGDYTRAINLLPNDSVVLRNRARTYVSLGRLDDAIRDFQASLEIDAAPETFSYLGEAYAAQREHRKTLTAFTAALEKRHPSPSRVLTRRARVRADMGQHRDAILDYTLALKLDAQSADAYLWRGTSFEELGEVALAHADYTMAVRLWPAYDNLVPLRQTRYLRIANRTGQRITVSLRYETYTTAGHWRWFPARGLSHTFAPGESSYLAHDGWRIHARTIRIWAKSRNGLKTWTALKDRNHSLVEAPYRARKPATFTQTFLP